MILLPTRRRLEQRRDLLYENLYYNLSHASVHNVEAVMRKIHGINLKLRNYFQREHEPKEIFED